jgi:hypothetical protein
MPAAFESGLEPDLHNLERQIFGDQAFTDGKDVGVIMLPGKPGRFFIPAKRAAYAMHFVRHHCFAVPGSAEHDSALALTARYRFRRGADEKRVIDGFLIKGAEVFHFVPERAEQFFHLFLVPKTGVIRSERDFHAGNLLIETRDYCRGQLPTVQFCQFAPDLSFALG